MRAISLLVLVALSTLTHAQVAFDTDRFDVDVKINHDRSFDITEKIAVNFRQARHGILRTIPHSKSGRAYGAEFLEFTANGKPIPYTGSESDSTSSLKIGDPDTTFIGPVTFTIHYKITHALTNQPAGNGFGEHTEFYWNVVPLDWPTGSAHSHITIEYPDPKPGAFGGRVLFGPEHDRAGIQHVFGKPIIGRTDLLESHYTGRTRFDVETKRKLDKGFGITVVFALPKGTVDETDDRLTVDEESQKSLGDYHFEFPSNPLGLALPVLPALLAIPWALSKRAKVSSPMVVRFDPPAGIDPILAGVLADNRFEPRDVLAGIVSIAQKGGLVMKVEADTIVLKVTGARPSTLTPLELQLLNALTPFGPEIVADSLKEKFNHSYNLLRAATLGNLETEGLRRSATSGGCVSALVLIFFILISVVGLGVGGFFGCGGAILGLISLVIVLRLPTPWTQQGAVKRWELDGLREFIMRAQKDPIEFAVKYVPNAAMYERLLPYAIGFGLAREWSSAFQGIDMPAPTWFEGDSNDLAWNMAFMHSYSTFDNDWSQAVVSAPASTWSSGGSGFGGGDSSSGGFSSGGGFDGGGGFSGGGDVGGGGGGGGGGDW